MEILNCVNHVLIAGNSAFNFLYYLSYCWLRESKRGGENKQRAFASRAVTRTNTTSTWRGPISGSAAEGGAIINLNSGCGVVGAGGGRRQSNVASAAAARAGPAIAAETIFTSPTTVENADSSCNKKAPPDTLQIPRGAACSSGKTTRALKLESESNKTSSLSL